MNYYIDFFLLAMLKWINSHCFKQWGHDNNAQKEIIKLQSERRLININKSLHQFIYALVAVREVKIFTQRGGKQSHMLSLK